jgi:hypothetical protein
MKKIIRRIALVFIAIGIMVTWRSCFRSPAAVAPPVAAAPTTPPPAAKVSSETATKPATPPIPEAVETIIPQYKGWKAILVGGMTEEKLKELNEGDTITVRYLYQFQETPEDVEMLPVSEKSLRKFTGHVIYDGIAGPEDSPLRLKFASGKYSVFSNEDNSETEISHELYEQLMGTYSKLRVLPADDAGVYGYFEVKDIKKRKLILLTHSITSFHPPQVQSLRWVFFYLSSGNTLFTLVIVS